jgi:hypothetical protein
LLCAIIQRKARVFQDERPLGAAVFARYAGDFTIFHGLQEPLPALIAIDEQIKADIGVENKAGW